MKRLKIALLAAGALIVPAFPAIAQHAGHMTQAGQAPTATPATTCAPEHAAMGHCTFPAAPQPQQPAEPVATQATPTPAPSCTPEHAAMGHCTLPSARQQGGQPADRHTGHAVPAPAQQVQQQPAAAPDCAPEHAAMGHCTPSTTAPAASSDPHAGHQTPGDPMAGHMGEAAGTNLPAGNTPPPPVPEGNAADAIYGRDAMGMGRHHLNKHHGGQKFYQVMANVAEYQFRKGRDSYEWDAGAWYGGDINRFWLKSEGEVAVGRAPESAEVQALYSRALDPYWNLQGGVRYDFRPNPSRAYAVIGVEGLAPSFFDVEGALFLSNKGELLARAEGSYDQRITQRLILQPSVELNFSAQNSRELGIGAGLSDAEVGLRLRYDIRREFAPYVGVQYSRSFGNTRKYLRAEGEDAGRWGLLAGIRAWF